MLESILTPSFFSSVLRAATPILYATLASGVASKAGITNMALEGIMLFSALFGVIFSSLTQSALIGLLLTILCGALLGMFLAFFVLNLKTDEILAAIAINLMATGGTVLILLAFSGDRGVSSSVQSVATPTVTIPIIKDIPFIGEVLSGQNVLTWLSLLAVVVMHLLLYKTPLGLNIRSVGENKNAAESVGINSRRVQYIALILSGALTSIGGFFLSGGYMNSFTKDMSSGRGFIALAAASMGGNTPIGGFLVSLLFGFAQALANIMQLKSFLSYEFVLMVPYLTTLIGLGIYYYSQKKKRERLSGK
ncbi:MAG: ABC transporter permease [Clostridiales bacterium]|nr:ABC transporter permease [Clostridiales bacterium]MCD8155195.1 ABC transporter permease [Clostridiales bacterium]